MKKVGLSAILAFIALSGCDILFIDDTYYDMNFFATDINVPHFDTTDEYSDWIEENIQYQWEEGNRDNFQTPDETILSGEGDCEDIAILLMYLIKTRLNLRTGFVVQEMENSLHAGVQSYQEDMSIVYYYLYPRKEFSAIYTYRTIIEVAVTKNTDLL